jgi:hypothetical protein
LIFIAEDPFRRERLAIADGRWSLRDGAVQVPITQREHGGFHFRLLRGKEAITDGWLEARLPVDGAFVFFGASGAMVPSADDVPQDEEIVLLHAVQVRVAGLELNRASKWYSGERFVSRVRRPPSFLSNTTERVAAVLAAWRCFASISAWV